MHELRTPKRSALKNERGFTLVELMISLAVFAVGILAVASLQTTASSSGTAALRITESATLAMDRIETAISRKYDDVVALDGSVETVGPYELEWEVQPNVPFNNVATVIVHARRSELGRVRDFQLTYFKKNI